MIDCKAKDGIIIDESSAMEMAMTYVLNSQEFLPSVRGRRCSPASNPPASKPGILRRIVQAMFEWRQAQADREIARLQKFYV